MTDKDDTSAGAIDNVVSIGKDYRAPKKKRNQQVRYPISHPSLKMPYDPIIADRIIELTSEGLSFDQIREKVPDLPNWHVLARWRHEEKSFNERYLIARQIQAERLIDQVIDIADNSRDANLASLRIKTRQWIAAKRIPHIYGDSVKAEIEVKQPEMTAFEAARRLVFAMQQNVSRETKDISPIIDKMSQGETGQSAENPGFISGQASNDGEFVGEFSYSVEEEQANEQNAPIGPAPDDGGGNKSG